MEAVTYPVTNTGRYTGKNAVDRKTKGAYQRPLKR